MSQTTSFINMQGNSKKNKKLQINSILYTFILLYCLLSFQKCPSFVYPSQSFSFSFSLLLPFSPSCLHSHKELVLILSCILISLEFGCIASKFNCNSETLFQWSRTNFLEGSSNVLSSFPDLFCTSHCWNYPDKYWGRICLCQLAADFLTVVAQHITLVYMLRIFRFFNMFTWGFVSPAQILCLYKSLLCQNIHCLLYNTLLSVASSWPADSAKIPR